MSVDNGNTNLSAAQVAQSDWLPNARFMPSPLTAAEKARLAASYYGAAAAKSIRGTRWALGTAAVAIAVTMPNLSLEAMVGAIGNTNFGTDLLSNDEKIDLSQSTPTKVERRQQFWSPSERVTQLVLPIEPESDDIQAFSASGNQLSAFDRELPLAVLSVGSQEFDLAFASVEMPTGLTALVPPGVQNERKAINQTRGSAIATRTIAIEQITDLDLVLRATPENVGADQQSLSVSSSSARTDAIANRSVEAAFAGAIDASSAVRTSLPIAPDRQTNQSRPVGEDVRRALPVSAPPAELRGAAAAETVLVPKTKLDARVNGVLTGSVDFQQRDGTIAIRLRSVANMMREKFSETEFSEILGGQSIDSFMTLAQLQAAGIPISYSPAYDEVEFGIDYQDAPNAKKVQIDQISVAPIASELTSIEQIPR